MHSATPFSSAYKVTSKGYSILKLQVTGNFPNDFPEQQHNQ